MPAAFSPFPVPAEKPLGKSAFEAMRRRLSNGSSTKLQDKTKQQPLRRYWGISSSARLRKRPSSAASEGDLQHHTSATPWVGLGPRQRTLSSPAESLTACLAALEEMSPPLRSESQGELATPTTAAISAALPTLPLSDTSSNRLESESDFAQSLLSMVGLAIKMEVDELMMLEETQLVDEENDRRTKAAKPPHGANHRNVSTPQDGLCTSLPCPALTHSTDSDLTCRSLGSQNGHEHDATLPYYLTDEQQQQWLLPCSLSELEQGDDTASVVTIKKLLGSSNGGGVEVGALPFLSMRRQRLDAGLTLRARAEQDGTLLTLPFLCAQRQAFRGSSDKDVRFGPSRPSLFSSSTCLRRLRSASCSDIAQPSRKGMSLSAVHDAAAARAGAKPKAIRTSSSFNSIKTSYSNSTSNAARLRSHSTPRSEAKPTAWPVQFAAPAPHLADLPLPVRLGLVDAQHFEPFQGSNTDDTPNSSPRLGPTRTYAGHYVAASGGAAAGYYLMRPPPGVRERPARSSNGSSSEACSLYGLTFSDLATESSSTLGTSPPSSPLTFSTKRLTSYEPHQRASGRRAVGTAVASGSARSQEPRLALRSGERSWGLHDELGEAIGCHEEAWKVEDYFVRRPRVSKGRMRTTVYQAVEHGETPYRWSYDTDTLTAEIMRHALAHDLLSAHTLTEWPRGVPPQRVLDVGCGVGAWCVDVAQQPGWEHVEVVGLDLVPIQTPLRDAKLAKRVTWVVADALKGLTCFPDASFDFVHMRFMGNNSIPEEAWQKLVASLVRVTAPGGRLEILESDGLFIGRPHQVAAHEIKALVTGQHKLSSIGNASTPSGDRDIDALEACAMRCFDRRGIAISPLSLLPATLAQQPELTQVRCGNPRNLPLLAEPGQRLAPARTSTQSNGTPAQAYTTRAQIGAPLTRTLKVHNLDLVRAMLLTTELLFYDASRHVMWAEAEAEKELALRLPSSSDAYAHPWSCRGDFERVMDAWVDEVRRRADVGGLMVRLLGWDRGGRGVDFAALDGASRSAMLRRTATSLNEEVGYSDTASGTSSGTASPHSSPPSKHVELPSQGRKLPQLLEDRLGTWPDTAFSSARKSRHVQTEPQRNESTVGLLALKRTTGFTAIRKDEGNSPNTLL